MEDWDGLLKREGPAVWRTAYRLLGHRADAEECFQETFVAALQLSRREGLREARAALQMLATARAMDLLRRRYRNKSRVGPGGFDDLPATDATPLQSAAASELSDCLRDALATLPARQAEAFCLFSLEGWTYQQIGTRLGCSIDAVGVTLHRARARLRQKLAVLENQTL